MMKQILLFLLCPSLLFPQTTFEEAETYFVQENFSKAKPLFEAYLKQYPKHKKTREYLGDIAGFTKDWDTAINYYEGLVEEDQKSATYHFKYGGVLGMKALSVNKLRAATYIGDIKEHFEKAASLDPSHIEVRWALVEFYIQVPGLFGGSEAKAVAYANELAKISPVDGHLANGYIAEYNERPKDAERHYKQAITVGRSVHTYDTLTKLYEKNNEPEKALATAKECLAIHKERNSLHYQIGKITAQYNLEAQIGIDCLETYIKNHSVKDGVPKDWAYFRLAQIYKNQGKKQEALDWIDKALVSRSDFKEAQQEKKIIQAL
jgi:tetratricopeptide (TPR) repeat protein